MSSVSQFLCAPTGVAAPLQGEMVDRIEANIKQSSDYVVKAKENTQQAVTYQKKARKASTSLLDEKRQ